MQHEDEINPTKINLDNFTEPISLFVTSNGDIYIDDGKTNGQVRKWVAQKRTFDIVMYVKSSCYSLFVDTNNTLYCSMYNDHYVVKISLNDPDTTLPVVAAGIGSRGSAFNEINLPMGIFVDVNFDLYVADCGNDRIQLFESGDLNGITVAGSRSPTPTTNLNCPSGIVLDVDKNLFIVDLGNDRIVVLSLNGSRCLVGCYRGGSQSDQLFNPFSFSFDRFGNIFVADDYNHRIQKFKYLENCFRKLKKKRTANEDLLR